MTGHVVETMVEFRELQELIIILEEIFSNNTANFFSDTLEWMSEKINKVSDDEIIHELISRSPRTLQFISQPTDRMKRLHELRWIL